MNPTFIGYLGFLVAAIILIWAVLILSGRLSIRKKLNTQTLNHWVKLDSTRANVMEDSSPSGDEDDNEEKSEQNLHIRAQQNGHYSQSKKLT